MRGLRSPYFKGAWLRPHAAPPSLMPMHPPALCVLLQEHSHAAHRLQRLHGGPGGVCAPGAAEYSAPCPWHGHGRTWHSGGKPRTVPFPPDCLGSSGASSRSRFFTSNTLIPFNPQVAHGFRPPISPKVPPGIAALIERCWKGLPELRPTMAEVVQELEGMQLAEGEQILKYREILCGCDALGNLCGSHALNDARFWQLPVDANKSGRRG